MRRLTVVHWLWISIAVIGVAFSGPLMAMMAAPALAIAFWRNALGAAVLAPAAGVTRRAEIVSLTRRDVSAIVAAGIALGLHFATWIAALKLTSVAAAVALVSTQVVWVVLIERVRGVKPVAGTWLGVGTALAGVLVITGFDLTVSRDAVLGDLLAVAGAAFAAVYFLIGARVRTTRSSTTYNAGCFTISATTLAVLAIAFGQSLGGLSARDWALILAVTVTAQLLGHGLFNHVLSTLSVTVVSLMILLEVPLAALIAAVLIGEGPPVGTYLGLALILGGLALVVIRRRPGQVPAPGAD